MGIGIVRMGIAGTKGNAVSLAMMRTFSPYYGKGIAAIDACTVRSKQINCIVIEE